MLKCTQILRIHRQKIQVKLYLKSFLEVRPFGSEAIHKAKVEFSEEDTKASPATAMFTGKSEILSLLIHTFDNLSNLHISKPRF